jgi:MSHA biogenesis protein MshO
MARVNKSNKRGRSQLISGLPTDKSVISLIDSDPFYSRGFTLIELIIVIMIIGILSGVLFTILRGPMQQYVQVQQRATLVDIAETALQRMTREIRLALPNSIRIATNGTITSIEFLRTLDGGRYRDKPHGAGTPVCGGPAAQDVLSFTTSNDCFQVLGTLSNLPATGGAGATRSSCLQGATDCLVIFNTGQAGANAYAGNNIAGIEAAAANAITFDISPLTKFPYKSPNQRFQIVDTPVSFLCNTATGEILRLDNYDVLATQPVDPPPGSTDFTATATTRNSNLLVNKVSACSFAYTQGTASRAAMVSLQITIADTELGQEVTLLQQAHVDNQP